MYLSPNFGTVLAISILAIKGKKILYIYIYIYKVYTYFEAVAKVNEILTLSHCIYCCKDMHIMETANSAESGNTFQLHMI